MTEGRNTGFKKILNALEANGSPKPEFETDEDRSYFITRIFVHERFYEAETDEQKMSEVSKNERSLSEVLSEVLKKEGVFKGRKDNWSFGRKRRNHTEGSRRSLWQICSNGKKIFKHIG